MSSSVTRTVHICCGYPNYLDQTDYLHAPKENYLQLAPSLDAARGFDWVSIEDLSSWSRSLIRDGCSYLIRDSYLFRESYLFRVLLVSSLISTLRSLGDRPPHPAMH